MLKFFNELFLSHQVCTGFDTLPLKEKMLNNCGIYLLSIQLLKICEKNLISGQESKIFRKKLSYNNILQVDPHVSTFTQV